MELVDEKDRRRLGRTPGRGQDFAQLRDIRHDRVDADKTALRFARDGFGNARLAATGRTVEKQRPETVLRHQARQ